MSEKQSTPISLSSEQLQQIINSAVSAAVSAANAKPPLSEFEKLKLEDDEAALRGKLMARKQDEALRKQQGEQELAIQAGRRAVQMRCRHMHANNTSSVAEVPNVQAVICLHCQAMIKAAPGPNDEEGRYIYDENLYWNLISARFTTTL